MAVIQLYAGPVATEALGCRQGRAAAAEWVQHKVARLYAAGLPASEIARRQGVKLRTVRSHIEAVYQRLGVCRRDLARALLTADVQTVMTRPANRAGMRRGKGN